MKLVKIDSVSAIERFEAPSGQLMVTDPCYTPGTWCAGVLANLLQGPWNARVGYHRDPLDLERLERQKQYIDESFKLHMAHAGDNPLFKEWAEQDRQRALAKLEEERAAYKGRVAYLHIWHESYTAHQAELDARGGFAHYINCEVDVGVDSGQAGFFDRALYDQAYSNESDQEKFYEAVCELTLSGKEWGAHEGWGVVSSSGWGDGGYDCLTLHDAGKLVAAVIVYLVESDEEDSHD